jgi:V/A-type H+-transporting ATPase subunit F
MRMHVLGSPDLVSGFRLAGIKGDVVAPGDDAAAAFARAANDPDIAILVISGHVAQKAKEAILAVRVQQGFPIVVEVADVGEPARDPESLTRFVGEAVGLRL